MENPPPYGFFPKLEPDVTSIPIREEVIDNVISHEWWVIEIPLLGTTAAGQPIDFGDIDPNPPTRPWAASLIQGSPDNYYCVTVRGQSMTEADIKDGDHILLRYAQRPQNGEIMLVRHDDSSTLSGLRLLRTKMGRKFISAGRMAVATRSGLKRKATKVQGKLVAIERKPGKW